ncbi:MAG: class 1a ribonucleoside-diphosphate reductase subunit alpha, partial [Neisseria sp.]|uniref:class 1a ribonucleoside-diphosphate reductase subunit alpha n=1 Tax=Neisseria sp. TaxID=192066 RepID=UPI0026DA9F94
MNAATANLKVTKRDGRLEEINLDKIHRVITWAAEGLDNVSVSQVELKSHIQFYNGIRTDDIHETIIKAAADLISQETPDYQYLAARLAIFHLRKIAYGQYEPPHLFDHVERLAAAGKYDKHLLQDYSRDDYEALNAYIDHDRDLTFSYAAVKQLDGKYLLQNRVTRQIYETPQFLYILVAMSLFAKYPEDTRLDYVKRFYDAVSTFKISLPTPIMSGVRTPTRQFSSCVLIECDDSLDSINATTSAIVKYVSQRAGIGINAGRIRGLGSEIRGGEAQHTGCIPFFKMFQAAVKSCSQGGVRGGAATLFYPLWHIEVESLLVLKNNRGVEDNRVRHLDYGVQINRLLYTRLIKGGDIALFSPHEVPGLYDAFFADQDEFERLYIQYEQDPAVRKRVVPATELFSLLMQERAGTGRIYIQNVDHCNTHSPFDPKVAPVRQSNLCLEIALPTKPLNDINDENGEIALCTLSAFNLGALESLDELEGLADLAVRALDALLDYQDYPVKAAYHATMNRR